MKIINKILIFVVIAIAGFLMTPAINAQFDDISDGGDYYYYDSGYYDYDYDYDYYEAVYYDEIYEISEPAYSYLIYSYEYPAPYDSYYYEPAPGSVFIVPHSTYDPGYGSIYIPPQYNPPTLAGSIYTPPVETYNSGSGSVWMPPVSAYNPGPGSVYIPPAETYNPGPGSVFVASGPTYNPGSGSIYTPPTYQGTGTVLGASISSPSMTKTVRNITLDQTVFQSSTEAQPVDIVEFEIRVRNNASTGDYLTLRDLLPQALEYITRTTKVNGIYVQDGIASSGINLGFFSGGEEKVIQFRAIVVNSATEQTVTNRAIITSQYTSGDAYAQIVIKRRGQVLGAANILTGPEDLWIWILASSLSASSLLYWLLKKYRIMRWGAFLWANPEIDLERRLAEMRAAESHPDIV